MANEIEIFSLNDMVANTSENPKSKYKWKFNKLGMGAYDIKGNENYFIEKNELIDKFEMLAWICHLSEKNWFNFRDFNNELMNAFKSWNCEK